MILFHIRKTETGWSAGREKQLLETQEPERKKKKKTHRLVAFSQTTWDTSLRHKCVLIYKYVPF